MGRILALVYGLAAYLVFLGTFLYAIGFVGGFVVPKAIDTGSVASVGEALVVNVLLLTLFAVQHSVMARTPFKRWSEEIAKRPAVQRGMAVGANLSTDVTKLPPEEQARIRKLLYNQRAIPVPA